MPGVARWCRVAVVGVAWGATVGAAALAQDGPAPPPPALMGVPMVAGQPTPAPACAPGRCYHRGPLSRRMCKRRLQEKFMGFPEEFIRPPLGASLYANMNLQVGNGTAAAMTLYRYDFEEGTDRLSPRGRAQLAKIAAQLPVTFFPLVVEATPETPGLAQARRYAVLAELARGTFPVPTDRVVVAAPAAIGLQGIEAELISQGRLGRLAAGGPDVGVDAGAGGFVGATQTISTLGGGR